MFALFSGMAEHQLDDKNRIRIPAKFRKDLVGVLGDQTYSFARGKNGCIYVLPYEVLQETLEKLSNEKMGDSSPISLLFMSSVHQAEEDSQGRVVLPAFLRQLAGITKDVITVGRGKRLEIWDPVRYQKYVENIDYDKAFSELGI